MVRRLRYAVLSLFIVLAWGLGWITLWTISFYLTHNGQQAALLLPHGVHLALLILLARRYWPALLLPEIVLTGWLHQEQLIGGTGMLLAPFVALIVALPVQRYWHRFPLYWQRLLLLLAAVTASALLNAALLAPWIESPVTHVLLASFTGGILLTPFVYLVFEYLRQQYRYHLLGLDAGGPTLRTSLIVWCSLFFIIGVGIQTVTSPEIERLLLIVVFLPNVVMAWKFGWQGGVLAAMLGSIMIAVARQVGGGFGSLLEMELFLSTQALLGIGLGIAISRQEHLVANLQRYRQRLEAELQARRELTEKLVHAEENARKTLAHELHDEIGQNITAIQIQSQLVKRGGAHPVALQAAEQINDLARRIHLSTRQLLRQLRPPMLDEMTLEESLRHLITEFAFAERGITCRFHYQLSAVPQSEIVTFTLYRLLQELLNNVCKHAQAGLVEISLTEQPGSVRLEVRDDGVGLAEKKRGGLGIQGMSERVSALGGDLQLESRDGTRVTVNLPTLLPKTSV